jgi:hypothetical protein
MCFGVLLPAQQKKTDDLYRAERVPVGATARMEKAAVLRNQPWGLS